MAHALARDLHAGEMRLLIVAVTLVVAALTAVGFFADRLKGGLARDARQLLGGDAVVVSGRHAHARRLRRAGARAWPAIVTTLVFPSIGPRPRPRAAPSRLVALKAVPAGYPLRGNLRRRVHLPPDTPGARTRDHRRDRVGRPALLEQLALRVGDPLLLGNATLRAHRPRAHGGARPRQRLRQLRAAGDDQLG